MKRFLVIFTLFLLSQCSILQSEDDQSDLQNLLILIIASRSSSANSSNSELSGQALEFSNLVNNHRTSNTSCSALQEYKPLNSNAFNHSQDMMNRNFFDHDNPDGKSPFDRMRDDGISYDRAGENIAKGQQTAQSVLTAWLNSSGHRANIENCNYTHHGIGLATAEGKSPHWTHVFAQNPR